MGGGGGGGCSPPRAYAKKENKKANKKKTLFKSKKFLRGKYINYAYAQKARKGVLRFFTFGNIFLFSKTFTFSKELL
jgi:hypothetical protein